MIKHTPSPLLEAHFFLANRAVGFSWENYFTRFFASEPHNPANERLHIYEDALLGLFGRLEGSIEADEPTLDRLYKPFHPKENDDSPYSSSFAANLLIPTPITEKLSLPDDQFIRAVELDLENVPYYVLHMLKEDAADCGDADIGRIIDAISESGFSPEEKILLADIAANAKKYADMLFRALLPVAAEFRRCGELTAPLIELFEARYEGCTAESVLRRIWWNSGDPYSDFMMFPLLTYANNAVVEIGDGDPPRLIGGIGALQDFLRENYMLDPDRELRLPDIMSALSNTHRFNIMERLLSGAVYGRELAAYLELSPVTISKHIGILVSAGLVTVHNEGTRTYYSLNTYNVRRFIERLKKTFAPVLDEAGETPPDAVR